MIVPGEFFNTLGKTIRINRLTARRIEAIHNRATGMSRRLEQAQWREQKTYPIREKSIIEHIRERVIAETSITMHDNALLSLSFTEAECPQTYNLMTSGSLVFASEEE